MDGELKIKLTGGVVLHLFVREDKNSVRVRLTSDTDNGAAYCSYAYAMGCITPSSDYGHNRRVRLSFAEGDETFDIWVGPASFDLPMKDLQAVRDFLPGVDVDAYARPADAGLSRSAGAG